MTAPPDPSRCPLCGGPNGCGMAQGKSSCWCMTATLDPRALERVPAEAKGEVCVCARCAALGLGAEQRAAEPSE